MSELTAQNAGMQQSKLQSMIVQFNNQNEQHLNLIVKLGEMKDSLAGDYSMEVAKTADCIAEVPAGIVPQLADCLIIQNKQIQRLEALLKDLSKYI